MATIVSKIKTPQVTRWGRIVGELGRIGKALLFPIAMLPLAAIFLRIGAQIPTTTSFSAFIQSVIIQGGNVVFNNLPIIFAIGVAFGLTKESRGEAAMAGFIGMTLVMLLMQTSGADLSNRIYGSINFTLAKGADPQSTGFHRLFGSAYDAILAQNVLNGIISGGFVAYIYNRYNSVVLPQTLSFFAGRRLIPVLTISLILLIGILWAVIFPWIGWLIYKFSVALSSAQGNRWSNSSIMFVYGIINRLLLPFGLHHIPNTLFWFQFGSHLDAQGQLVNGDINIFIKGVAAGNTAGTFQSGFFPIMMFGLPTLVYAMYVMADNKQQKQRVLAMMSGAALISFLTGITEPIEFSFLFLAPTLFGLHALLTGLFGFITGLFGIQLGFGFSAGLIDYLLSIPKSMEIIAANKSGINAIMANPAWIWVIGAMAAATYFYLGRWFIKHFNVPTPGRGVNRIKLTTNSLTDGPNPINPLISSLSAKEKAIVRGFGGWDNIVTYSNCATRLRYDVKDGSKVNDQMLKRAGAFGVMHVSATHVQAIMGTSAETINQHITNNKGIALD